MGRRISGMSEMHDKEYIRLQAVFLEMANQADQWPMRARWLALSRACKDSLIKETRSKPDAVNFGTRCHKAA